MMLEKFAIVVAELNKIDAFAQIPQSHRQIN
jgi:hypothetical protein